MNNFKMQSMSVKSQQSNERKLLQKSSSKIDYKSTSSLLSQYINNQKKQVQDEESEYNYQQDVAYINTEFRKQ